MTIPRERLLELKRRVGHDAPDQGDEYCIDGPELIAIIDMALRSVSEATVRMVAARQESGCNAYGIALSVCSDLREAAEALRRKP